jgi:transposase
LAKNVFQVHGVDANDKIVVARQLRRRQLLPFIAQLKPCLVKMEACGGTHHFEREITKHGYEVKLMSRRLAISRGK